MTAEDAQAERERLADEAADLGLVLCDEDDEAGLAEWHLWPGNERTWSLWCSVQTQWRTGMAGATGLDYAGVWAALDRALPRRRRDEAFACIRGMECAVLEVWRERAEQQQR